MSRANSEPPGAAEPELNGDGHDDSVHGTTTQPEPTKTPPTKEGGTGKGKGKLKASTKKDNGNGADGPICAWCGEPGPQRCTGCGMVYYCRKNIVIRNGKKVNMCQEVTFESQPRTGTHALRSLVSFF